MVHPFSKLGRNNQPLGEGLGTRPTRMFLPLRWSLCGGGDVAAHSQLSSVAVLAERQDKVSGSPWRATGTYFCLEKKAKFSQQE